jgi:hypothetical protein
MNTGLMGCRAYFQQLVLDVAARQRIERAERLVEQQHLRLDRERARDADALFHPARKLGGLLVLGSGESDEVEIALAGCVDHGAVGARPARPDRELDVFPRGEPWHQRMSLENDAAVQARAGHLALVHEHQAGACLIQTREYVEDRRFAATGVTDDADELAFADGKIDVLEHRYRLAAARVGKGLGQSFDFEKAGGHEAIPDT